MKQTQRILNHLKDGKRITSKVAMEIYGISRLAAVVYELRKAGHLIEMERITVRNRFDEKCVVGRYRLQT